MLPLPSLFPCFVLVYPGDKRVPAQSEFLPRAAGGAGDGKTCLEMELALRMRREDVMMDLFKDIFLNCINVASAHACGGRM